MIYIAIKQNDELIFIRIKDIKKIIANSKDKYFIFELENNIKIRLRCESEEDFNNIMQKLEQIAIIL